MVSVNPQIARGLNLGKTNNTQKADEAKLGEAKLASGETDDNFGAGGGIRPLRSSKTTITITVDAKGNQKVVCIIEIYDDKGKLLYKGTGEDSDYNNACGKAIADCMAHGYTPEN